jgi:hypothetical protein
MDAKFASTNFLHQLFGAELTKQITNSSQKWTINMYKCLYHHLQVKFTSAFLSVLISVRMSLFSNFNSKVV